MVLALCCRAGRSMARVYFFAGPRDTRAFAEFLVSRGMHLVPNSFEEDRRVIDDDLVRNPECRVSPVPFTDLRRTENQYHPEMHSVHRNAIGTYGQPVIDWRRSHPDGNYLIAGDIEWVDWAEGRTFPKDAELLRLNAESGKVFRAARRWIHKHWTKQHGIFWHGPHALELEVGGLTPTSFHPDKTTFSTMFVERATGETTEVIADSFEEWSAMKRRPKPH